MDDFAQKLRGKLGKYESKYAHRPIAMILKVVGFSVLELLAILFKSLKKTYPQKTTFDNVKFTVCFELLGGYGDIVVVANYIEKFAKKFGPNIEINITSDRQLTTCKDIFWGKSYIKGIIQKKTECNFCAKIILTRYPIIDYIDKRSKKLNPKLYDYLQFLFEFNKNNPESYDWAYPFDFVATNRELLKGNTRTTMMDIGGRIGVKDSQFRLMYDENAKSILNKYGLEKCSFATIQRGAQASAEATKIMSLQKYNEFTSKFKRRFPDVKLVQLGRADTTKLENIDVDLRGKTDANELKATLDAAKIHIDCECGMVHLKNALNKGRSVVFFGPTSPDFFAYEQNLNFRISSCKVPFCEWLDKDWTKKCIAGLEENRCINKIDIDDVIRRIVEEKIFD